MRFTAAEQGVPTRVLDAVEAANDAQKHVLVEKIVARLGGSLEGRRFALWGLAFKPDTDALREAATLTLIAALTKRGATIAAYDPVAVKEARRVLAANPRVEYAPTPMTALDSADALVIATEWKEFRSPDFDAIRDRMKLPLVFDGRNLYDPALVKAAGLEYFAIGRR